MYRLHSKICISGLSLSCLSSSERPLLRLEALLPDGLYTVAEVVEDVAALDAAACREKAADDAGDVLADVEVLWVIDTNTLHAEAEPSDAVEDHRLSADRKSVV